MNPGRIFWEDWLCREEVTLWQAVDLSIGRSPRDGWYGARFEDATDRDAFDRLGRLRTAIREGLVEASAQCGSRCAQPPGWPATHINFKSFVGWISKEPGWAPIPEPLAAWFNRTPDGNADTHGERLGAQEPLMSAASGDWREQARRIADELFDHDTRLRTRDSLHGYSKRVESMMQEREIHGPRGRLLAGTIKREALQGRNWWQHKVK